MEGFVRVRRIGQDSLGFANCGLDPREPRFRAGPPGPGSFLQEGEHLAEMIGPAENILVEPRGDGKALALVGFGPEPDAGDIGFAGTIIIGFLIGPIVALESEAAGFFEGVSFEGGGRLANGSLFRHNKWA
jgi:hypothetical protein